MNRVSINENPDAWSKETDNALKIVSLNCAGLKAHFHDIQTDDRLRKADVIHLVETSLKEAEDDCPFTLDGYQQKFIKNGNGKGIATYYDNEKFKPIEEVKTDKFQIVKFKHNVLDIIHCYHSDSKI